MEDGGHGSVLPIATVFSAIVQSLNASLSHLIHFYDSIELPRLPNHVRQEGYDKKWNAFNNVLLNHHIRGEGRRDEQEA